MRDGDDDFNLQDLMRVIEIRRKQLGSYSAAMAALGAEMDEPLEGLDAFSMLLDEVSVVLAAYPDEGFDYGNKK